MKIKITMKDPDTLVDAVRDAVRDELASNQTIAEDEREQLEEMRREKLREKLGKWFEYGEYLRVEYDSETDSLIVLPVK